MTSSLEYLPAEIRIQVLQSLTDFPSLRSLIHASPLYHTTYLQVRREVLCHLSLYQLDHRLRANALAAVRSQGHDERPTHTPETVNALFDEYREAEVAFPKTEWLSCCSITEAVDLLHLHEAVKRITEDYCRSIASKMAPKEERPQPQLRLSQMEQLRFYRGTYRFQLYCNLFGPAARWTSVGAGHFSYDHNSISRFFEVLQPWEVLEIAGIWHHLNKSWASILRELLDMLFPTHISKGASDDHSDLEDTSEYLRLTRHGSPQERRPDIASQQQPISSVSNQEIGESRTNEMEDYSHYYGLHEKRRFSLAHRGPRFLTRALAQEPFEVLEDLRDMKWAAHGFPKIPFDEKLDQVPLYNVERPHELPESDQPSRGWKWFCHKYEVGCLNSQTGAIEPSAPMLQGKQLDGATYELSWGYPYWDKEKLERWGVIMPAEGRKKKKDDQGQDQDRDRDRDTSTE
jgi:hypothetical protein